MAAQLPGGPTGYAMSPARDLSPRLMHTLLPIPGKRGSDGRYAWIPSTVRWQAASRQPGATWVYLRAH